VGGKVLGGGEETYSRRSGMGRETMPQRSRDTHATTDSGDPCHNEEISLGLKCVIIWRDRNSSNLGGEER